MKLTEEQANWKYHGTRTGYMYGCRCAACREANRVAQAEYITRRRAAVKRFIIEDDKS